MPGRWIRLLNMALIKSANSNDFASGAVVLDLGDLFRQGEQMLAEAARQAAGMVRAAGQERERLLSDAGEVGKAAGFAAGYQEGTEAGALQGREAALAENRAALGKVEAAWAAALDIFLEDRARLLAEAKTEVITLAAAIATAVIKKQIQLDPTIAARQVEQVLAAVMRPSRLVVRVHPDDRSVVESALPGLLSRFDAVEHVQLVDDGSLGRGSCVARLGEPTRGAMAAAATSVGGGEIDASIRTQTQRIVELLLPGAGGIRAEATDVEILDNGDNGRNGNGADAAGGQVSGPNANGETPPGRGD